MNKTLKNLVLAISLGLMGINVASGELLITEVVDGNRIAADGSAGSSPDPFLAFMELTNTGTSALDLTGFHYINFNNGGTMAGFGSTALSGMLAPGETYYIAYESDPAPAASAFETVYGFTPNEFAGGKFINGDDVLMLLDAPYVADSMLDTATIADVYGVFGVDGSGEAWEYQDTYAFRDPSITSSTSSSTFDIAEWTVGMVNDFDGEGAAGHIALTSVVPEPSGLALISLAAVSLMLRRKN